MQKINIQYNPYKMKTKIEVNGTDVCKTDDCIQFKEFIDTRTPLQTWAGSISYKNWKGIVNEIASDENCFDRLQICFHGRKIDFDDLQRVCEAENEKRKVKLEITYSHEDELSDKKMAQNIDVVMRTLLSDKFKKLVEERGKGSQVVEDYQYLEEYYNQTKNKEFKIVFAGLYSSGKSTILNTLIRREILPMAGDTCTSKTCRIKHDPRLKNKISLECFDENGKVVVPKEVFENDADCLNRFWEITPLGELESVPANVNMIEICLDLSHLYPSKEMEKEFNLVIIDTPGCNSSKTIGNNAGGENKKTDLQRYLNSNDKKIALDAITGGEKEMVVICADAQDYEDESIGDFLRMIHQSSEEDAGDFNDRFLFLLNKCDALIYGKGEALEGKKEKFANYITDTKKWGIKEKEGAPKFVPRIFMSCAYINLAIQCGAANFTEDEKKEDKEKRRLWLEYDKFCKLIEFNDEDYCLARVCDIPVYRKQEFADKFNQYMKNGEKDNAVAVQTGIGCLESAIKDYIARYAYPFKVRDLLNTFDALLADVTGFIEYEDKILKDRMSDLGKGISERKEVKKGKSAEEKRKNALVLLKSKVTEQKRAIDSIKFDSAALRKTREDLHVSIEGNSAIQQIREGSGKKVKEQHSHFAILQTSEAPDIDHRYSLQEINEITSKVSSIFSKAWDTASSEFEKLTNGYQEQLHSICGELKAIVKDMQNNATEYDFDEYNFNTSLSIEKINRLDVNELRNQVSKTKKTIQEEKVIMVPNPIKSETYKWWQFIKRLNQWFAPEEIEKHIWEGKDVYSAAPLQKYLTETLVEFDKLCESTENNYESDIECIKKQAKKMADDVLNDITTAAQKISEFKRRIDSCGDNIKVLNAEIDKIEEKKAWLERLQNEIRV